MNDAYCTETRPPHRRWTRRRTLGLLALATVVLSGVLGFSFWKSRSPDRRWECARQCLRNGDLEAVEREIDRLARFPQYAAHRHYLRGAVLLHRGRLPEALAEFRSSATQPELEVQTRILVGQTLYQMGNIAEARRVWQDALRANPCATDAHRWLGVLYFDIGAMEHALDYLGQASQLAPHDPRPQRLMALIHKDFEVYAKATEEYRESLRRDPNQPQRDQVLLELAECLVKQRRHAEALQTLRDCPRTAPSLTLQAESYHAQGDKATAAKVVQEALDLAPRHLSALQLSATFDLEAGNAKAAVQTLRRAVESHPREWRVRHQLSRAYQRLGQPDLAKAQIQEMQELRKLWERFAELHKQAIAQVDDVETRYQLGLVARAVEPAGLGSELVCRCAGDESQPRWCSPSPRRNRDAARVRRPAVQGSSGQTGSSRRGFGPDASGGHRRAGLRTSFTAAAAWISPWEQRRPKASVKMSSPVVVAFRQPHGVIA